MATRDEMLAVWERVREMAKKAAVAPNLYRALDKTVAVAWEDGFFAIGLDSDDGMLLSALNTGEYRLKIEQAVRQVTGDTQVKLRLLDGPTLADWERAKANDIALEKMRQQQANRTMATVDTGVADSWDGLYDQISRLWSSWEYRTLPSGRARFLSASIDILAQGLETLGEPNEQTERAFSRTLDRVASHVQCDAGLVGYLLFERQRNK